MRKTIVGMKIVRPSANGTQRGTSRITTATELISAMRSLNVPTERRRYSS